MCFKNASSEKLSNVIDWANYELKQAKYIYSRGNSSCESGGIWRGAADGKTWVRTPGYQAPEGELTYGTGPAEGRILAVGCTGSLLRADQPLMIDSFLTDRLLQQDALWAELC